jgi:hypothetical protein
MSAIGVGRAAVLGAVEGVTEFLPVADVRSSPVDRCRSLTGPGVNRRFQGSHRVNLSFRLS